MAVSNNFNRLVANCGEVPTFKSIHGRTLTEVNHSQEALKFEKVNENYLAHHSFSLRGLVSLMGRFEVELVSLDLFGGMRGARRLLRLARNLLLAKQ